MMFSEIAKIYLDGRVVSDHYAANVVRVAARCGSPDRLNEYLKSRLQAVAATTAKAERTILLGLWKYAYDSEILEKPPRGILKIKQSKKPTRAWTIEQIQLAIAETHKKDGVRMKSGASLGEFLRCWLLFGYEAGARYGDIFSMRREHVEGDVLRWTQAKTGDPISKVLSPRCAEILSDMAGKSPDGRILGWCCKRRQAMRLMKEHLISCGLDGSSKWLRRSGATHIEIEQPGKAQLHLGHRTVGLAAQAYIDWGQVRKTTPRTPCLLG